MLSVRLDRSYEQEACAISTRVLSAETDLADKRKAEAEELLRTIAENPATNHRRLMATPEGVTLLIARWAAMKADLDHEEGCRWNLYHSGACDHLKGNPCRQIDISPYYAWSAAIHGNYEFLRPEHFEGMATDEEEAAARHEPGRRPDRRRYRPPERAPGRPRHPGHRRRAVPRRRPGPLRPVQGRHPRPEVRGGGRTRPVSGTPGIPPGRGRGRGGDRPGRRLPGLIGFVFPGAKGRRNVNWAGEFRRRGRPNCRRRRCRPGRSGVRPSRGRGGNG